MITYYPCMTSVGVFCAGIQDGLIYSLSWPERFEKSLFQSETSHDLAVDLSVDLDRYFAGNYLDWNSYPVVLDQGTAFQHRVWDALRSIPYGQTVSYSDIAVQLGSKAVRAVGSACGHNRVPIIIPCHRVINKNGGLGGYSAGLDNKRFLLQCEGLS